MGLRLIRKAFTILTILAAFASCNTGGTQVEAGRSEHRSVYYWKTTFELGKKEQVFLAKHDIDRIYLRMFDVDVKNNYAADTTMVIPVATAQFKSPKPDSIEVVPAVFITVNALRHYEDRESELAGLITKRVLNMCSYHDLGPISEIQFDCDWTETTRGMFCKLCEAAKKTLHEKGILLSGTIRLHQIEQAEYPFDKGVLMVYNTGAIKDPETGNSIIAYDDVKKYLGVKSRVDKFLAARKNNCTVIDVAYPTFYWNVAFRPNGTFDEIISEINYADYPLEWVIGEGCYRATESVFVKETKNYIWKGQTIRPEYSDYKEVMKVKNLVESTVGGTGSNIIYHLDNRNLSKYSDNEIENILR